MFRLIQIKKEMKESLPPLSENLDTSKLVTWQTLDQTAAASDDGSEKPALAIIAACGSYNPIHTAHCQMFDFAKRAVQEARRAVVIGGFASPVNDAYGKAGLAPFSHRAEIVRRVLDDSSSFVALDAWEGLQSCNQRSYTVLSHIREACRDFYVTTAESEQQKARGANIQMFFLCGGDLFETFYRPGVWKLALLRRIFEEFEIVVAARADSRHPLDVVKGMTSPLTHPDEPGVSLDLRDFAHRIIVFELPENSTSSTRIRQLLAAGEPVGESLLPKAAAAYCVERGVYEVK